jgi:hypothetical protein
MTKRGLAPKWAVLAASVLLGSAGVAARLQDAAQDQEDPSAAQLNGSVSVAAYADASSDKCKNGSPFAGMNPMVCHGEVAPVDSMGKCSLQGLLIWKQVGSTCYYCKPIVPPIKGIVIPWDQGWVAEAQGFACAANMSDNCTTLCVGPGGFKPSTGVRVVTEPPIGQPPNTQPPPPANPPPPGGGQSPAPSNSSGPCPQTTSQQANDFFNQLLNDGQTLLQNAGRISKAMTDANDVTKHNNVGVRVGLSSCVGAAFGVVVKGLGIAAQQFKTIVAARCTATQDSAIVQIANDAASESGTMANQATQASSQLESTAGAAMGVPGAAGYMENAVVLTQSSQIAVAQGNLPTCTVLACDRLAQLLGRNIPLMRVFESIRPTVKISVSATGETTTSGGLTAAQVANGLQSAGINAQVGTGMTNMMNQVRAGNPVIAGVYSTACSNSPLHAVVVEAVETQGGVSGLRIYDPVGWIYWQPIQSFQKYFTGEFINAL